MGKSAFLVCLFVLLSSSANWLLGQQDSSGKKTTPTEAPKPVQTAPAPASSSPTISTTPTSTAPSSNNPGASVGNPNLTVPPIIIPLETAPTPRKRRRTVDSLAILIAQLDSSMRVVATPLVHYASDTTTVKPIAPIPSPIKKDSIHPPIPLSLIKDTTHLTTDTTARFAANPFDIKREEPKKDSTPLKPSTPKPTSLLSPEVYSKNFLFWIFLIDFLILAFVVSLSRYVLPNTYQSLLNEGSFRAAYKEQTGWGSFSYLSLYFLFWVNLGVFVFLLTQHFGVHLKYGQFVTFLACIGAVSSVFIIKHIILYFIAAIFPIAKAIHQYNFIIIMSGILIGLILAPLNIFIAYSPSSMTDTLIYAGFAVIIIIYLLRTFRSLSVGAPFLMGNRFHFFLYLCSVELAPIIILLKFALPFTSAH